MEPRGPLQVFFAVVIGVSLIGVMRGTSPDDYDLETPLVHHRAGIDHDVPRARSYTEMRRTPRGEGSGWEADLAALRASGPGVLDPVPADPDKAGALADRAALRAYDGAPPRIPHPIRQDAAPECLACHDEGLRFRGRLATPMSHPAYASCTQCHVVDGAPMPGGADLPPDPRAVETRFVGLASPDAGPRAWAIAPPQVPHRVFMRERCTSCHGVNGRSPMRSSHPAQSSCEQCHAASAETDLRPGVTP